MSAGVSKYEAAFWIVGTILSAIYAVVRADGEIGRRLELARVESVRAPEFRDWSPTRVAAYRASLNTNTGALLGTVTIRAVGLEVPLYADTRELHLNRGAGLIERTARPGTSGNMGIAGHRDGFFRVLKGVKAGETIEVRTPTATYRYRISVIRIVPASDARLLAPTAEPSVTLVTCYPFYFVGNAPQRFVVRGLLVSTQEDKT